MTDAPVERLLAIERQLDRSFIVCVILFLASVGWPVYLRVTGQSPGVGAGLVAVALGVPLFGCYVWFAVSVARAANALGSSWIPYLAWLILSPLFMCLPIPFVGTLIAASPLSLKFFLSGQLRSEIHRRTFADA